MHALNCSLILLVRVSSSIVGAPVPVGVSLHVTNIEKVSEESMVSIFISADGLGAGQDLKPAPVTLTHNRTDREKFWKLRKPLLLEIR